MYAYVCPLLLVKSLLWWFLFDSPLPFLFPPYVFKIAVQILFQFTKYPHVISTLSLTVILLVLILPLLPFPLSHYEVWLSRAGGEESDGWGGLGLGVYL